MINKIQITIYEQNGKPIVLTASGHPLYVALGLKLSAYPVSVNTALTKFTVINYITT
jgi:hypothetical protein